MSTQALVNITMPVFNRLAETVATVTSFKKHVRGPYVLTVVDNKSQDDVRAFLCQAARDGLIDNLFLLDNNYGISCAVNTGWTLVPAQYHMKMDNDIESIGENWLDGVMQRWQHVPQPSIIGPLWRRELPGRAGEAVDNPDGRLWESSKSLPGLALIIPQTMLDTLGYLSEDYGLYGAEDADYCVRVKAAGYTSYAYEADDILVHLGDTIEVYKEHGINKMHLVNMYAGKNADTMGLYLANEYLYLLGIRPLKTPLKYRVAAVNGQQVSIAINRDYLPFRSRLLACLMFLDQVRQHNGNEALGQSIVVEKVRSLFAGEAER